MSTESYAVPVSVKGIVFEAFGGVDQVWLRQNERDEWELPGGKLDAGEQPEDTVVRELDEELGFQVEVVGIVQNYLYTIEMSPDEHRGVLVASYLCKILGKTGLFETVGEAGEAQFAKYSLNEIDNLTMPDFYKRAIRLAYELRTRIAPELPE
jgi:8-oxo-dGTP pyrophosphatase MutT (NUDIX family)